ncbi:MAG: hypothetical protein ACRD9L_10805 [Bryobacteraceae bacterium]
MEPALIFAQRLIDFIRQSGMTKMEAYSAMAIARLMLDEVEDIATTRSDQAEQDVPSA